LAKNIRCSASAFIIKENNLLFAKNINSPYYYLVGGGIEENETSEEAVIREIFEETGLILEINKLVIIQERFCEIDKNKFHEICFFYSIKNNDEINIADGTFTDQGTAETLHWIPINKLSDFNSVPKFLKTKTFDNMDVLEHIIVKEY
jgi:ADP-ribose pyrophosphatase YjhB (NUDIX family)